MASRVPSIAQVRPGAAVSIVLKQDQPTGRQVQGVIHSVLTRGNHPRGIKVRLQDGRVGRVQRIVAGGVAETPSPLELQTDLRNQQQARSGSDGRSILSKRPYRSERLGIRYTDSRQEEVGEEPPTELDLMSFVKEAKPKKKRGKGGHGTGEAAEEVKNMAKGPSLDEVEGLRNNLPDIVVKCPICDDFEGDETAVAHHIGIHLS